MRRALFVLTLSCILSTGIAGAHEAAKAGFGKVSPDAPPETVQFGFLIGEWACGVRGMGPDGAVEERPQATWTGYYILGGWAIQDDWATTGRDGKSSHGTNVRSFNPETGKWDNRWLASGSLRWQYFEAEQVDDTMVMTGDEGVDRQGRRYIDRNIFYEIGEDSWKWRKDRSFDGGDTWLEGVALIDCRSGAAVSGN